MKNPRRLDLVLHDHSVVAGDAFAKGPDAGTVLLAIRWTRPAEMNDGKDEEHFETIAAGTK